MMPRPRAQKKGIAEENIAPALNGNNENAETASPKQQKVEPKTKKTRGVKAKTEDDPIQNGHVNKETPKKNNKTTKKTTKTNNAIVESPIVMNGKEEAAASDAQHPPSTSDAVKVPVSRGRKKREPTPAIESEVAPPTKKKRTESTDDSKKKDGGKSKIAKVNAPIAEIPENLEVEEKPTASKAKSKVNKKDVKESSSKPNGDVKESPKPKKTTKAVKAKVEKPVKEDKKTEKPKKASSKVKEVVAADVPLVTEEEPADKKETKKKAVRGKKAEENVKTAEEVVENGDSKAKKIDMKPTRGAGVAGRKRAATVDAADEAEEPQPSKAKKPLMNATNTDYKKSDFELSAQVSQGHKRLSGNKEQGFLKISSWNVAGLRSWLKKDGLKYLDYEEPDIFCMQEIKCTTDQVPEEVVRVPGYHPYWLCMPGGYAGVAIYSKIMPINIEYGIGNEEFDAVGRVITAEYEKFYLINVYVPNSGRKLVNLSQRMRWEKLFQDHVKRLDALKPVVICGDMNCSHQEIDLANPKTNTRSAGFTKEERDKLSELLSLGFVDTFRHLYPDQKGAYTYWTYMSNARARNVGWRLDYFLVSERIVKRVIDNCIRSQCKGSDHCPITLFIDF